VVAVVALALGSLELIALNRFAVREVTWAFPIAFDQAFYGLESFWLYEQIRQQGWWAVVLQRLVHGSPQGVLLQLQGTLACVLFGPGWLRLLNVNFVYFLLLQSMTAYAAWHASGKRLQCAVLSVGLLLAVGTPYFWAGGVMDFRLDFAAFCLYGMLIAAVIRSAVFGARGWSLAAAGIAGVLVWLRMLTMVYVVGIGVMLLAYFFFRRRARRDARLRNASLWLGVLIGLAAPLLLARLPGLYAYYWVGHVAGPEPEIRAREWGITDLWGHISFYPRSLFETHLGFVFLALSALVLVVAAVDRFVHRRERLGGAHGSLGFDALVFCACCLLVPLVVLTVDVSKSPVVAGITSTAAVWLVIVAALQFGGAGVLDGKLGRVLALVALAVGVGHTSQQLNRHLPMWEHREEVAQLLRAYDQISATAIEMGDSQSGGVSIFGVFEYLNVGVLDFLAYERRRVPLALHGELGLTVFATDLNDAMAKLDRSSFVVTAEHRSESQLVFPFDRTLQLLIPKLTRHLRERFIYMTEFSFKGVRHELYRRPFPVLKGISGDWVTADGLLVEISEDDKRKASRLILRGSSNMGLVPGLQVSALSPGRRPGAAELAVPVDFRVNGNDYTISVSLAGLTERPGPLSLRLSFSSHFIPKELGENADARRLVIWAPRERRLVSDAAVAK
jgi:hypothetical protein